MLIHKEGTILPPQKQQLLDPGTIIIITAPSGSGKTTLVKRMLGIFPVLEFSVSACTRSPRSGEIHGKDYYFYTEEAFLKLIEGQAFAEWEMVYAGKYYGTLHSELQRIWKAGKVPVVDIDVQGALNIRKLYPHHAVSIFICAPSLEALGHRLQQRNTETPESLRERLNKAAEELTYASRFQHVLVNDNLEQATVELQQLICQTLSDHHHTAD